MLKKVNRLTVFLLKNPKTTPSKYFTLKSSPNNSAHSRFGFVVTKRIDKRSVVRNETKRKVRSCIEEIFDKIENGRDFVFIIKADSAKTDRNLILEEIYTIFKKEGYLK
jgi:ribonuclease P protein component